MADVFTLYVEAGATYFREFVYTDPTTDEPFDLTGYTAEIQIRESVSSATATLTITPTITALEGTIAFELSATQTATLTKLKYVYALELYGDDDLVIRLAEGGVIVSPEVVR
jgi:hypothetical protein